jgi:hypothetical protein
MLLYFAGPLFCEAELRFNAALTERIEALEIQVFLPQRDGVEKTKPPYDAMSPDERRAALFALDRDQILACDIFLFVLDGRVPDEGACVELGIAYAQRYLGGEQKFIIGLKTGVPAAPKPVRLNPMLLGALDVVARGEDELLEILERHVRSNDL